MVRILKSRVLFNRFFCFSEANAKKQLKGFGFDFGSWIPILGGSYVFVGRLPASLAFFESTYFIAGMRRSVFGLLCSPEENAVHFKRFFGFFF